MNSGIDYEFRTTIAKPLLDVNDFDAIGKLIKNSKRFYLQNYVEPPKQVDITTEFKPFTKDELMQAQKIMQKYVKDIFIR